jgi:hypothetical protein
MSGRRIGFRALLAAALVAATVSACGGSEQNPSEPHGNFPVTVTSSFPTSQKLAQETEFVVSVKNSGHATIPNVAVTVTDPKYGDAAQSFGMLLPANGQGQPILASRSRPVWIITQAPGKCGYSCKNRGPGGAATAYTDTWALGKLKPGQTATFSWHLTAIKAGAFTVRYQVAAGLNGYAKAVTASGGQVSGQYRVKISQAPQNAYVEPNGTVTYSR